MQIISHRGYWKDFATENNKRVAFERSFKLGFGTETDLRDANGKIVISHNIPCGGEMTFRDLLEIMDGRNLPLALNIKADGLIDDILSTLAEFGHTNYFTFDMSIPDMIVQMNKCSCVFTGMSDVLNPAVLLEKSAGVWLDSFFEPCWFNEDVIKKILNQGKKICVVSEDLHNRENGQQWAMLKSFSMAQDKRLILCTNFPENAKEFFEGKNENQGDSF